MQAARGASLSLSDQSDERTGLPEQPRGPGRARTLTWFGLVAVLAWGVDLTTKTLALTHLEPGAPVQVVGDWLRLLLTRNPGAAFSTGTGFTEVFTVIAVVAVAVVVVVAVRARSLAWAATLGLLLGGIGGNLTDRLVRDPGLGRGHVVDFLALPHWPVFNVADICIDVAAGCILLLTFRGVRLDGSRAT